MSEQQTSKSASLLDNQGQQILPNTRGELVWLQLDNYRVKSLYSPEVAPIPEGDTETGTVHLSWVLARTPRLDLANEYSVFNIGLRSGNSILPIVSMTSADGLILGTAASPLATVKRYVSGTDRTYIGGTEISTIDSGGLHSQRGVSAKGICDLSIAGGGGGQGTVTSLVFGGNTHVPTSDGVITVPATEFVSAIGGATGAITLRGGQTANGSVNLAIQGQQIRASIVGLGTAAYKADSYFVPANTAITGATKCKVTYNANGLVTGGADLAESDIPNLSASKITTGTLAGARIPAATADSMGGFKTGYSQSGNNFPVSVDATTHKAYATVPLPTVNNPQLTICYDKGQGQRDIVVFNANGTANKKFGIFGGSNIGLSTDNDGYLVITNGITSLSQLTDDSTHRFVTDTEKSKWNSAIYGVNIDTASLTPSEGVVTIPYATAVVAGAVSTGAQTFAGNKTFNGSIFGMKGVSAKGICDLSIAGGSGGGGTVTAIKLNTGSAISPDTDGIITLPVYSTTEIGNLLSAKADASRVTAIESLIPAAATSSNQLADKDFVNSSIATNTATFRGTSAANLNVDQFLAWANSLTHDNNDYVFWNTKDSADNVQYKRYKYNGSTWVYEYTLNNSSFTAAQWEAINSGATSVTISSIAGKEAASNKITAWGTNPNNTQYPSAKLVKDSLDGKQSTLPTNGTPTITYAINISGNAATLENHDAAYFATAAQIELTSTAIQSLQSQIDSVASKNHFDELIVTSLFADVLVGVDMYGTLHGNADTATKLGTARTITIGSKSNSFDGSANITFTLADIGAKPKQTAIPGEQGSTTKTLTGIAQDANGVITPTFADIATARTNQKGLIALGYSIPSSDTNHLHAPLVADASGKGYALSQIGWIAGNQVFDPTPNF